jgi:hypothetical protein
MMTRVLAPFFAAIALAALIGASPSVSAAPDGPADEADVAVQARGPVHEGFAQPFDASPRPGPVVPKAPPDPVPEVPPDQKPEGDNVQWLPGYWSWDGDRNDWLWVSGFWRAVPPDRQWVPGYWRRADDGWQWVSGYWAPAGQDRPPLVDEPPAPLETGPSVPAPDDNSFYVPGVWVWREQRFCWRPGYWRPARLGWVWTPAHYVWTPAGCVFVDGCWDYPLDTRGVLFAPVVFERPLWRRPGWCFRPSFVVCIDTPFFAALFVRPSCGHYYFGDYYDPACVAAGYQPWCLYGARHADPLFGYYRWAHRGDPAWLRDVGATYAARRDGTLARPPHTLAEQGALLRRAAPAAASGLAVVRPLRDFRGGLAMAPLSGAQVAHHQAAAHHFHELAQQRPLTEKPGRPAGAQPIIVNHPADRPHGQHSAAPAPAVNTKPPAPPPAGFTKPEVHTKPLASAVDHAPPPKPVAPPVITKPQVAASAPPPAVFTRPEVHTKPQAPTVDHAPTARPAAPVANTKPPAPAPVSRPAAQVHAPPPRPAHASPPPSHHAASASPPPSHGGGAGRHDDSGQKKK